MQNVCFGREIHGHQRPRLKRRGGRHIQDSPILSLNHCWEIQPRQMRERGHVELDLAQTFFQIVLGKQAVLSESCVVHQHIDPNTGARGLIEHVCRRSRIGQIGGQNQ